MKDPTRLLEGSASELELRLLRAGAVEQPPAAAMQRLLEQLGGAAPTACLQPAAATKLSLLPMGMVALGITLAGLVWLATRSVPLPAASAPVPNNAQHSAASAPALGNMPALASTPSLNNAPPSAAAAPSLSSAPAVAGAALNGAPLPAASAPALGSSLAAARDAPARRSTPTTPDGETSSIALEIARIDEIRRTLAADRAKAAITTLQDYRRDFPEGVLRQEADVLSIEAHRRVGDRRRARVLASRFLAEHPESPHSARVRELLDALGPDAR